MDPFQGCDLSTVDATSLDNLKTMREVSDRAGQFVIPLPALSRVSRVREGGDWSYADPMHRPLRMPRRSFSIQPSKGPPGEKRMPSPEAKSRTSEHAHTKAQALMGQRPMTDEILGSSSLLASNKY